MLTLKYIFPNGQIWCGNLSFGLSQELESSIGLDAMTKHDIKESARLALDLGISDIHFNNGARLFILDDGEGEEEVLNDHADGMDVYKEMGLESPYESELFN